MKIVGVKIRGDLKITYCQIKDTNIKVFVKDDVVIETPRGQELATVATSVMTINNSSNKKIIHLLIRRANTKDKKIFHRNEKLALDAVNFCEKQSALLKLEMKIINAFISYAHDKLIIYFTADNRIDFRQLVKKLASRYKIRIELKQIGTRDGAGNFGGAGICGRPLCCASFMDDFVPVTINMAKEQNLSLNPSKISGICGRLMCCLKYEYDMYNNSQDNNNSN